MLLKQHPYVMLYKPSKVELSRYRHACIKEESNMAPTYI
jgi:hypothetical protein